MKKNYLMIFAMAIVTQTFAQSPVRVAVAGLSHGHVDWVFNLPPNESMIVAGIYEPDKDLIKKYKDEYGLEDGLFYTDLDRMLDEVKPQAVTAFGATSEHVRVVRAAAPRKVHVMVEKPLATTLADAREIAGLARENNIFVLTNYETSWYASNQKLKELVDEGELGEIVKVMVNSGHKGPKEIGVSEEFFEILTNPDKNGAGALFDFGCYGANLMTWLLNGERPVSVTAVTQTNKPEIYPLVDDEASIILQYDNAQCIIQGSWNWPVSRKDMEVYGTTGYAVAANDTKVHLRLSESDKETIRELEPREYPHYNPFFFLAEVIRGNQQLAENDLYGLKVNLVVMEILEAAKRSAEENRTVFLD